jgi:ubiquinone/menaquinone biosynthesis C-methylase UbiE
MNIYSELIFPRLLDTVMSKSLFSQYRQTLLTQVSGEVLDIGFGTGLNLPYYPGTLKKLTAIDINPGMNAIARQRLRNSSLNIDLQQLNGEHLPMADYTFDTVVSTWTLCSIADVNQALREIDRVLKPGGKFLFIEHGLSTDSQVQVWQHRLTPVQKIIADGCHLNRNIEQLITDHNFQIVQLDKFYAQPLPKFGGYFYQGWAIKDESVKKSDLS